MYPSTWQILIVLGVLLLFFGQKKIREFGKSLGESLRDFRKGLEEKPDKNQQATKEVQAESSKNTESKNIENTSSSLSSSDKSS